jgi:hypothetical protein
MRALNAVKDALLRFAKSIAAHSRTPEFSCGDCDSRDRCGLPPHRDCVVRAEQLALDGRRPSRRFLPIPYWSNYPPPPAPYSEAAQWIKRRP